MLACKKLSEYNMLSARCILVSALAVSVHRYMQHVHLKHLKIAAFGMWYGSTAKTELPTGSKNTTESSIDLHLIR